MKTTFDADLLHREFGGALLHVPTFLDWLKEKKLHINAGPLLSGSEFVQVEILLCAVGEAAIEGLTHEQASAIVANDTALRERFVAKGHSQQTKEMLVGKLKSYDAGKVGEELLAGAHFSVSSAAHQKWRVLIAKSVNSGELVLLDFASKLPMVAPAYASSVLSAQESPDEAIDYEPLASLIQQHLSKKFLDLPGKVRERVEREIIGRWDDWTPTQRASIASQHDLQNDPAMMEENIYWAGLFYELGDVEDEITRCELMSDQDDMLRASLKKQVLTDLKLRLSELKFMTSCPYMKESDCDEENEFGYTVNGAALAVSEKYSLPLDDIKKDIFEATKTGNLQVRRPGTGIPYTPHTRRDFFERISVPDLNKWFESVGTVYRLDDVNAMDKTPILKSMSNKPYYSAGQEQIPVQRSAAQDVEILKVIRDLAYEPLELPRNVAGKRGVKAAVRAQIGTQGMWSGSTIFDKAWVRLTKNGDIKYLD